MKPFDKQISDKASLFPVSEFACAIIGSIGAGKTTCALNLLLHGGWNKYFNRIIICAPCIHIDKKLKLLTETDIVKTNIPLLKLKEEEQMSLEEYPPPPTNWPKYKTIDEEDIHQVYDPSIIDDVVKWQEYHIGEYGELADKVLIVLDDAIALGCFDLRRRNELTLMITRGRHVGVSTVMLSQYYHSIPPVVRTCLTACFFFETNNLEREHLFRTFDLGMDFPTWNEYVSIICGKKAHSCCQINKLNPKGSRLLWEDKEIVA